MAIDNAKQFQDELKLLIQDMLNKGLIPAHSNIKQLIDTVTEKLNNDPHISLSVESVRNNPAIRKAVGLAIMMEMDPKLNELFDYKNLFKQTQDIPREELKQQLKNVFTEMLKLKPGSGRKLTEEQEEALDRMLDQFVNQIQKEKELLCENNPAFRVLAGGLDPINEQRRQLYGVGQPGEIFIPVRGEPIGDQIGNANVASGMGYSFEDMKHKAVPGAPDDLGIHMITLLQDVSSDAMIPELEAALKHEGVLAKNHTPTLHPKT